MDWIRIFNMLFEIINPEDNTHPNYFKGSRFIDVVREFDRYFPKYSQFIQARKNDGLSISRKDYFYEILMSFDEIERIEIVEEILKICNKNDSKKIERLRQTLGIENREIPSGNKGVYVPTNEPEMFKDESKKKPYPISKHESEIAESHDSIERDIYQTIPSISPIKTVEKRNWFKKPYYFVAILVAILLALWGLGHLKASWYFSENKVLGIVIPITLLLIGAFLFVAVKKGMIKSSSIQLAANIAGIISLLAALVFFVISVSQQDLKSNKQSITNKNIPLPKQNISEKNQKNSVSNEGKKAVIILDNYSSDSIALDLLRRLKNSQIKEHTFHYFGYKSKTIYEENNNNLIIFEDKNDTLTININFRDYEIKKDGKFGKPLSHLNESQIQSYKYQIINNLRDYIVNDMSQVDSVDKHSFSVTWNSYEFELTMEDSASSYLTGLDFHENGTQRLFLSGLYISDSDKTNPTYFPLEGTAGLFVLAQKKYRKRK